MGEQGTASYRMLVYIANTNQSNNTSLHVHNIHYIGKKIELYLIMKTYRNGKGYKHNKLPK